jgi:hypothetical protein
LPSLAGIAVTIGLIAQFHALACGVDRGLAVLAAPVLLLMGLGAYPAPVLTPIRAATWMMAR